MTTPIWDELSTNIERIKTSAYLRGRIDQRLATLKELDTLTERHPETRNLLADLIKGLLDASELKNPTDQEQPIPNKPTRTRTPKPKATNPNQPGTMGQATKRKATPKKTQGLNN